jgi:hypothetical protein
VVIHGPHGRAAENFVPRPARQARAQEGWRAAAPPPRGLPWGPEGQTHHGGGLGRTGGAGAARAPLPPPELPTKLGGGALGVDGLSPAARPGRGLGVAPVAGYTQYDGGAGGGGVRRAQIGAAVTATVVPAPVGAAGGWQGHAR